MTVINTSLGSFGKRDACQKRRTFTLAMSDKKGASYYKSVMILGEIKNLLTMKLRDADYTCLTKEDQKQLFLRILRNYQAINIEYEPAQMKYHAFDACRQISRFVNSMLSAVKQGIKPVPKLYPVSYTVQFGRNISCKVSPDIVFQRGNEVEVIKLHCSKPVLTQASATDGKNISSLELYALLLYGRQFARPGKKVKIRASVYYLRRKDDRSSLTEDHFEPDFFEAKGGGNIVSISEEYEKRGYKCCMMDPEADHPCDDLGYTEECPYAYMCIPDAGLTSLDRVYLPLATDYENGLTEEECDPDDCKSCDLYSICKYTVPPIAIVKEPITKTLRGIQLSDTQKEIINKKDGITVVNAAAGSGKTFCVCVRAVTLRNQGYNWKDMMLVTYTNTAAEEMKARIQLYNDDIGPGDDVSDMTVCTFDSFGNNIVREKYEELGFTEPPKVIDDVERSLIIAELLNAHEVKGLDYRNFTSNMKNCMGALAITKKVFDIIKTERYTISDLDKIKEKLDSYYRFCTDTALSELVNLYDEFDQRLKDENLLEFADMMGMLYDILSRDPWYLEKFGYKHIIVDEFQDSNQSQIDLIKKLWSCPSTESLMVVGDDAQAIYGFRSTSPEYIQHFEEIMGEPVEKIDLIENRRSTPEICEFANKIYAKNEHRIPKTMTAIRNHGTDVTVKGFVEKIDEQKFVLEEVKSHLSSGTKPEDIAIICATKYELMAMGDLLTKESIPSVMLNPELLCENSRVMATIAMVNVLENPQDTRDLLVFTNALIGGGLLELTYEKIREEMTKANAVLEEIRDMPAAKKKNAIVEAISMMDNTDDEVFQSFVSTLKFKSNYQDLVSYCKHFVEYGGTNAVRRTHNYPGVVLTTAHSSKGLEWPVVFNMISKYDTPEINRRSSISQVLTEERRRLLFVSATRARDELFITGQYIAYGKRGDYHYNRFLIEAADANGIGMNFTTIAAEIEAHRMEKAEQREIAKKERGSNVTYKL